MGYITLQEIGLLKKVLYGNSQFKYTYCIGIEKELEMTIVKTSLRTVNGKTEIMIGDAGPFKTGKSGSALERNVEYHYKRITGNKLSFKMIVGDTKVEEEKQDRFDINQRFSFVEKLVNMVAAGVQPSAVITGSGGLGKTYTVTKTLESAGYTDMSDLADFQVGAVVRKSKCFTFVKGYSTAKGLYRTLFENNKSIIIFDDCDAVLKDETAKNLLKGALDSHGKRIISWNADFKDEDLPRSFNFEGRVIFISNLSQDKIDQAIRSRSMMIDLSMTTDQKIARMEHIAMSEEFLPEYSKVQKQDALSLIREIKDEVKEISLRTLISVTKIRASNDDWKDLATYMLTA